jgi:hypothetical protein
MLPYQVGTVPGSFWWFTRSLLLYRCVPVLYVLYVRSVPGTKYQQVFTCPVQFSVKWMSRKLPKSLQEVTMGLDKDQTHGPCVVYRYRYYVYGRIFRLSTRLIDSFVRFSSPKFQKLTVPIRTKIRNTNRKRILNNVKGKGAPRFLQSAGQM